LTALQEFYYSATIMAINAMEPINPSSTIRDQYNIPENKKLAGHRITIKGFYFTQPANRDYEGSARKIGKDYEETFVLAPSEFRLNPQVALAAVLGLGLLKERLLEKDPDFRSIAKHEIVDHKNLFVDIKPESEQELSSNVSSKPKTKKSSAA
jgi:hypothetical protein